MAHTINPIKAALVALLNQQKDALGLKTIKADISPQDIVDACKKELAYFPALIINYAGRIPTREGTTLVTAPTYSVFVSHRDVSEPYVSGASSIDLIEDLVELIDGKRISNLQKDKFEFAGDQLMYQDASLVIYQLLFRTQTVHQRRF